MNRILLIDDDVNLCKVIAYQLKKNGYNVTSANSGAEGLKYFAQQDFELVITDIQMPDISGIQVLKDIRRRNRQVVVIIITAHGSVDNALEACHLGADDYLTKPFGQEQLRFVIEKALQLRRLQQENNILRQELIGKYRFENLVAHSAKMEEVLKMAGRVAASDATVLILGESGTGKELVARAIHYNSPRKDKPLVTVNCPSIPDNLLESELFGHVKGAFTGAIKDRKGKFEIADGGSIFLDEIGDLREDVQAKLLRVLQEHEVERLGGSKTIKTDVRVIAATNKNLEMMVQEGNFREDLYYRLSVVPVQIPPLRDRKEEVPYMVDFFIKRYAKDRRFQVAPEVITALQDYEWPGNVRELENVIERAVVLSSDNHITMDSLPANLLTRLKTADSDQHRISADTHSLAEVEKRAILGALDEAGGNRSKAARILKVPRHVLLYRLKKLNIDS
ncbi:MAG: sigma-54-dependent Fis family transcriptional regulator [Calditrichaeota bacterium]|nr:sigma-54-dependent Fis family transcriptional regulator [Calditrichota bacterium]MCB0266694.1 sigma-54-dependent Fis family transcriptional regulator [Calditrichota bacterium]MCB9067266.1 sigma-54-dependent Fis family transcriptional regulator [Calditrichia bacterium]